MRTFLSLAAGLVALAGVRADEPIAAPAPKPADTLDLDGKYTLNCTYLVPVNGNVWVGPGVVAQPATQSALRSCSASISRGMITMSDFDSSWTDYGPTGFGGWGPRAGTEGTRTLIYTLDQTKTPATVDVVVTDIRNKKVRSLGILQAAEDRITIALAKPGADRPKNMEESDEVTLYYFKKTPPPPKVEFRIVAMTVGKEAEAEKQLNKLSDDGFELVSTTNPAAADPKAAATTVHFVLKRTAKRP
jgi:hypothetical protein